MQNRKRTVGSERVVQLSTPFIAAAWMRLES